MQSYHVCHNSLLANEEESIYGPWIYSFLGCFNVRFREKQTFRFGVIDLDSSKGQDLDQEND